MKKVKLTDVVEINPKFNGSRLTSQTEVSFIPMQSVSEGGKIIDYQIKQYNEVKKGYTPFTENDILFAKITPCMQNGKRAIAEDLKNGVGFGSTEFHVLRPTHDILSKYLFYFISQEQFRRQAEKNMTGSAGQKRVPISFFKSITLNVPSIKTQSRIIEVLDKAQEVINYRKLQIEALDQLTQSVFLEMFGDPQLNNKGWKLSSLGNEFEIKTGGTPSRKIKEYWEEGSIPWVKTTEVKEDIILKADEFITEEGLNNSNVSLFPKETILVAMYGQGKTRGKSAMLGIEATTNQACAAILPNENHNPVFLWHQLMYQYGTIRELGRGGNQPNLNLSLIKGIDIILPPLQLQINFDNVVYRIRKQKEQLKLSLLSFENLYDAAMQRAFKGELFIQEKLPNA